jgi:hypothetical protein
MVHHYTRKGVLIRLLNCARRRPRPSRSAYGRRL